MIAKQEELFAETLTVFWFDANSIITPGKSPQHHPTPLLIRHFTHMGAKSPHS
jgi:hypothetical protein